MCVGRWSYLPSPTVTYGLVPFRVLPYRDAALPLGDHLSVASHENVLKGEFVDVFALLFREGKKEKENLEDEEMLKWGRVDCT